jgi:glycosyltransferase involved in cell wall biosynthesis
MREWVRKDPQTALAAALAVQPQPQSAKLEALRSVVNGWFDHPETDPNDLLDIIDQVTEVRPRGELVILWVNRMIEARGIDYAINYAESMPENRYEMRIKKELMGRLAAQLVAVDTERAVEFTERNSKTEAGRKVATYMINRWAHDDGPTAFAWALANDLPAKVHIVERAWRSFLIGDRAAALDWMSEQPYSKAIEPAYSLYLMNLAKHDHQRALELSSQIEDHSRHLMIWQSVGRSWIAEDPIGAEAWMSGLDLPPSVVQNIRARKPDPTRGRIDPEK